MAAAAHPAGAGKSDRQIGNHVGIDHATVLRWREKLESTGEVHQSEVRTGLDGRTTNTANIGKGRPAPEPAATVSALGFLEGSVLGLCDWFVHDLYRTI